MFFLVSQGACTIFQNSVDNFKIDHTDVVSPKLVLKFTTEGVEISYTLSRGGGVTSEPLCEIKFLNLWNYLWLHHLSGRMSLVSADLVILPPGQGS